MSRDGGAMIFSGAVRCLLLGIRRFHQHMGEMFTTPLHVFRIENLLKKKNIVLPILAVFRLRQTIKRLLCKHSAPEHIGLGSAQAETRERER